MVSTSLLLHPNQRTDWVQVLGVATSCGAAGTLRTRYDPRRMYSQLGGATAGWIPGILGLVDCETIERE